MQDRDRGLAPILDYLLEKRGFDFSGYHPAMLERRIGQRLTATGAGDLGGYLACLRKEARELDHLLDVLTINVSRFFRDTLTFELLADRILPAIVQEKSRTGDRSLRVWSAGCAMGEEPYSLAILIHELLEKEGAPLTLHLFATDIDDKALAEARRAVYALSSVENIRHRLLTTYFTPEGDSFRLLPSIRDRVAFSSYDMLDKKHDTPPESIFGHFDLVLCRNLLIYFNVESQERIFAKLYRSLAGQGVLILGEAEAPTITYQRHFRRIFDFCPIYRKG